MENNGILNRINTIIYTSNVNDAFVLIFFYYMWVFWIFFSTPILTKLMIRLGLGQDLKTLSSSFV